MRVLFYIPRMDLTWKEGPMISQPIPPIREHWINFLKYKADQHLKNGDEVEQLTLPLWTMTKEMVIEANGKYDRVYVPHRRQEDYGMELKNVRYYMQTVIPEYFTVDEKGWGPSLSFLPVELEEKPKKKYFNELEKRIHRNQSKFEQPSSTDEFAYRGFLLFACQIPTDDIVKDHSDVDVLSALRIVLDFAKSRGKKVIVKGHPVNPGSMAPLIELTHHYDNAIYLDNVSIHDAIRHSEAVFFVNSGVGFETILHEKKAFRFGNAEYANVIPLFSEETYDKYKDVNTEEYEKFINVFFSHAETYKEVT